MQEMRDISYVTYAPAPSSPAQVYLSRIILPESTSRSRTCLPGSGAFSCAGDRGETGVPAPPSPAQPLAALVTFPDQPKSDPLTITFNVSHIFLWEKSRRRRRNIPVPPSPAHLVF